jgi:SAM-dependent methyltransferase
MAFLDFISGIHNATKRNYVQRVVEYDKAHCAEVSKGFGKDYFDGDRKYGYGGFKYDGRWVSFTNRLIEHYKLKPGDSVLDIGCAKGFVVKDFSDALPGSNIQGVDISEYAINNCMPEVKNQVQVANATELPFADNSFDLVLGINVLHNLRIYDLYKALREIMRVGKKHKFIVNDSYRTESEKVNLMYWQLTCECFFTPEEWEFIFKETGYDGDYDVVCFQ